MRIRTAALPIVVLLTMTLIGCGGSESSPESSATTESSTTTEQTASGDVDRTVTIQPKGNRMKYKQTEFTVAPGETVKLVFENTATSPSMQHNVVIATSNADGILEKIGQAGTQAGSKNDYVPQSGKLQEKILAHTPISKPGETVSVTFTVPEETGEHGYVCTFPGHWATMQGTMYIKKGGAA
jgi:azurin